MTATRYRGHSWCAGDVPYDPDILRDPALDLVAPYIGGNINIFHCPADRRMGIYQGTDPQLQGKKVPAIRSVSMSQSVGVVCGRYLSSHSHFGPPNQATAGSGSRAGILTTIRGLRLGRLPTLGQ